MLIIQRIFSSVLRFQFQRKQFLRFSIFVILFVVGSSDKIEINFRIFVEL
jgi:hypothetical protein